MKKDIQRNNNIDLMRCIAALLVVLIHVHPHSSSNIEQGTNIAHLFSSALTATARICVPLFILASGYFCLSGHSISNLKAYYLKAAIKFIPPLIIATILSGVVLFLFKENAAILFITGSIAGAPYYHLWYLFMALGLYASVPFLILIRDTYGERCFLWLGLILLALAIPSYAFSNIYWCFKFVLYLGYFILGYSLPRLNIILIRPSIYVLIYIFAASITALLLIFADDYSNRIKLNGDLSPTIVLASFAFYLLFFTIKDVNTNWYKYAKYSLNFYILHAFTIVVFNQLLIKCGVNLASLGIAYTPLAFVAVTLVTYSSLALGGDTLLNKLYRAIGTRLFSHTTKI